jgi:hypothetical protein
MPFLSGEDPLMSIRRLSSTTWSYGISSSRKRIPGFVAQFRDLNAKLRQAANLTVRMQR